jgi:ribosomal-protein-alanine N-acetyltransferase
VSGDHLEAVLAFELANRAYFARSINDRGDEFYETFSGRHDAFLVEQEAGVCAFYVLVDRDGPIVGRFNLYDFEDGATRIGYRVAETSRNAESRLRRCATSAERPPLTTACGC